MMKEVKHLQYLKSAEKTIRICQTLFYSNSDDAKAYGQLVLLGYDVTTFTPAAYQGRSLQPPL